MNGLRGHAAGVCEYCASAALDRVLLVGPSTSPFGGRRSGGRVNEHILDLLRRRLCPDSRLVRFQIPEIRWYQSRNVRRSD